MEAEIKKLQEFYWSDADPDGRGFVNLAAAYRKSGDLDEALRILRDGLRRHPELVSGHVVAGWVQSDQGNVSEAEAAFRKALEIDPENISALRGLGEVLSESGDAEGALKTFQNLLLLEPLDLGLPGRVEELREVVLTPTPAEGPEGQGSGPWDDPEDVAEELNWERAALQEDKSLLSPDSADSEDPEAGSERPELPDRSVSAEALKDDTLVTKTMGDVLLRQGLLDESEGVYKQLLRRDPGDAEVQERLDHIQALRRGEVAQEVFGPGTAEAPPEGPSLQTIVPIQALTAEVIVSIQELAPEEILDIGDLAPDLVVPVESLAPDSGDGDAPVDAFEAWLDKLP